MNLLYNASLREGGGIFEENDGRSLRNVWFAVAFSYAILLHPPSSGAPSQREP